jgi:hypothetical protein
MQCSLILIRLALTVFLSAAFFATSVNSANADGKPIVVDWAKGSVQDTEESCGDITFKNIRDKRVYSFFVRGTASRTCVFHADGLTFRYPSNYGPVTGATRTFFGFARFGSDVLVTWTPGY